MYACVRTFFCCWKPLFSLAGGADWGCGRSETPGGSRGTEEGANSWGERTEEEEEDEEEEVEEEEKQSVESQKTQYKLTQ